MANHKGQKGYFLRKLTAIFLLISFTLLNTSQQVLADALQGSPASRHGVAANPTQILGSLSLPEELGSIQTIFHPETSSDRLVIYLQDAHANYDAESNIRKLIHYFQEKYGLGLVLLEGGEGRLDSLFFRSFPENAAKEKVLDDYLQQGELSGGEIASISGEYETNFYGIESKLLYDENKRAFLEAVQKEEEISDILSRAEARLESKAAGVFSSSTKIFHEQQLAFRKEAVDLMTYLKSITALLPKPSAEAFESNFPEIQKILHLETGEPLEKTEFDIAMNGLIDNLRRLVSPRLSKAKQMEMGQRIQEYQTHASDGGTLVHWSQEICKELHCGFTLPKVLEPAAQQARTLSSIRGTKLFSELNRLEQRLREDLPQSNEERQLLEDLYRIQLLKRLALLELSRGEWDSLNQIPSHEMARLEIPPSAETALATHRRFYGLAKERDRTLFKNLNRIMEKKRARVAVLVTGGFHAEGIADQFRASTTPFVLITPKITQMGDKVHYLRAMHGKASFMRYFKRNLWEALARDYGEKLSATLQPSDLGPSLKQWRDKIIRNLVKEGKIASAKTYTRHVDALARRETARELDSFLDGYFNRLEASINQKLEIFGAGLKEMWKTGNITPESIQSLIHQMKILSNSTLAVEIALIRDRPGFISYRRSEVRTKSALLFPEEGKKRIVDYIKVLLEERNLTQATQNLKPFVVEAGMKGKLYFGWIAGKSAAIGLRPLSKGDLVKITPILIDEKDPSKGAYLKIGAKGKTWYYRPRKKPNYFESIAPPGIQEILDYILVLREGKDLIQVTQSLKSFVVKAGMRGQIHFGSIAGRNVAIGGLSSLSKGDLVKISHVLIDEHDPSRGAHLKIEAKGKTWYYRPRKEPTYFESLAPPSIQGILDYIQALREGKDLTRVTQSLRPFVVEAGMNGRVYFGQIAGKTATISRPSLAKGDLVKITPVLINEHDPSKGAYLKIEAKGKTWYYRLKKEPQYFEALALPGIQEILNYIKALREGRDLTRVTQSLRPFVVEAGMGGYIYFGSIAGRSAAIGLRPLSKGDLVEITPALIDEKDPSKGAHLKIESNGKIWRYAFKKVPGYFAQATTQEKLKRIQTLKSLLSAIYRQKNDFQETIDITDLFSGRDLKQGMLPEDFPLPGGRVWGSDNREIKAGENLHRVEAIIKKSQGKLSIDFIGYRRSEVRTKSARFSPEEGKKQILDYILDLREEKDLSPVTQSLKPFQIGTGKNGKIYFGSIAKITATINLPLLNKDDLVKITPVLIDEHDPSKGAYLKIEAKGETWYYRFQKEPGYFKSIAPPGAQEILDYILDLREGKDLTQATQSLKPFKVKARVGRIRFGTIVGRGVAIGLPSLSKDDLVKITPVLIDEHVPSKGAYLKIEAKGETWYYRFQKEPGYFKSIAPPGAQEILDYILDLQEGKDLTQATQSLKPFEVKARVGYIHFATIARKNVAIGLSSLSKGDLVKITPILIDEKDPSKGAHLIIESNGKRWRYAFKGAPGYLVQVTTQEKIEKIKALVSRLNSVYSKKNDFEKTIDITGLFSSRDLKQGLLPEDFPLPGGRVWGPDNREIQAGENLHRVEAIIKKTQGKLSIDFIGYHRSEMRSKNDEGEKGKKEKIAGRSHWNIDPHTGEKILEWSEIYGAAQRKKTDSERAIYIFGKYHVLDLAVSLSSNPDLMQQALAILLSQQGVEMTDQELGQLSRGLILNLREGHKPGGSGGLEPGNPFDYLRGLMKLQEHLEKMNAYDQLVLIRAFTRLAFHDFVKDVDHSRKKLNEVLADMKKEGFFGDLIQHVEYELGQGLGYQPAHVRTPLKPHQRVGAWSMRSSEKFQDEGIFGFLLEDDTRMGKTIQTFAALDPAWKAAVTVPAGVMDTWEEQFNQHVQTNGTWKLVPVRGSAEQKRRMVEENRHQKGVILLFSIEDFQRKSDEEVEAISEGLDALVIDEAQKIETYAGQDALTSSLQARAIHKIKTRRKWILSASPYTSHPKQLFSVFHLIHTDPDTGKVSDPMYANHRVFNRLLTGNLRQMRWLYALKARIGFRRTKNEMGAMYSQKREVPPSEEGVYAASPEQSELTLAIIKNLGEYLKVYNQRVPPEKKIDEKSIGVLLKLQFLNWAMTDPTMLGENVPNGFWENLDRIVQKRINQNKKGIIFAQNTAMVDQIIARYEAQGQKVARIDGTVDVAAKAHERHLFQENPDVKIVVMNVRAGVGLDLSAADWVLYAQLPQNYVEYYQSSDRALGLNPLAEQEKQKEVEVLHMVAKYPPTFLNRLSGTEDYAYVQHGTPAELLFRGIMGEDRQRFELVMEGIPVPDGMTERKAITRLVYAIHGFLEDPSMAAKSKKQRKKIETAHALYPLYQKVKGDQAAEEEVLSLVDHYARAEVSPAEFSRAVMRSKIFSSKDLKWIGALFQIPNKLHRDQILNFLPKIFEKLWTQKLTVGELIERGPPALARIADLSPELVLPFIAASHAWKAEEDETTGLQPLHLGTQVLMQMLELIQQAGFSLYEERQWARRFVSALIPLTDLEDQKFLDFVRHVQGDLVNGALSLEEKIALIEELGVLREANQKEYEKVIAMREPFKEILKAVRETMRSAFLELFDLSDTESVRDQVIALARKWGSLKAPVQMMAKLRAGGSEYAEHVGLFKKAVAHILDGTYALWRNRQEGDPTGHEIAYRKDDDGFWEIFTREESVKLGDVTASQKDFRHIRQRRIQGILDFLEEKESEALAQAFGRLGPIIGQDLREPESSKKLNEALHEKGAQRQALVKAQKKNPQLAQAIEAVDNELATLRTRLNILELYRTLKEEPESEKLLALLKLVRKIILENPDLEEGELPLEDMMKDLEENLEQLGKPRKFEEVEVQVTWDPDLMMRRGMLEEELKNCFNLGYKPRQIATLVDDLMARNKMLAVVRAKGRIAAAAILKVRQDEQGRPVIMVERPLYRWGYNFEREIAQAVAISKLPELKDTAVAGDVYKGEEKTEKLDLSSTGTRGPSEYHETLFGWRSREAKVHHVAGIIYKSAEDAASEERRQGITRVDLEIEGKPHQLLGIGHSNRSIGEFLVLVKRAGIKVIADVRTRPMSQYNPQYNQQALKDMLHEHGIEYIWLGDKLGGKLPDFNDDFAAYMKADPKKRFTQGIEQLVHVVEQNKEGAVSLLCSEGAVEACHRRFILDFFSTNPTTGRRAEARSQILDYIKALREGRDLTEATQRLKPFVVETGMKGRIYFGTVNKKAVIINLARSNLKIKVTPILNNPNAPSEGAHLKWESEEGDVWYYNFKRSPNYFQRREKPGIKEILNYIETLLRGENLTEASRKLQSFESTTNPNGQLYFGVVNEENFVQKKKTAYITLENKPNIQVQITPILNDSEDLSKGAYLKLETQEGSVRYYDFKKTPNYIHLRFKPGVKEVIDYIKALVHGESNLSQVTRALQPFEIETTKSGISFGSVENEEALIYAHDRKPNVLIQVTPVLNDLQDPSKGAYLQLKSKHGKIWEYEFKAEPTYFKLRVPKKVQEVIDYVNALLRGEDLTQVSQALQHSFELTTTNSGALYFGIIKGNMAVLAFRKPNQRVHVTPIPIDSNDMSKGIHLELKTEDGETKYYKFKTTPSYFRQIAKPGVQEILDYIKILVRGDNIGQATAALKSFELHTTKGGFLYFGSINKRRTVSVLLNRPNQKIKITVILNDPANLAKGAYLQFESEDGETWHYDFKQTPNYFQKRLVLSEKGARIREEIEALYLRPEDVSETIDITPIMTKKDLREGLIPVDFPLPNRKVWGETNREIHAGKRLTQVSVLIKKQHGKLNIDFIGYRRSEVRDGLTPEFYTKAISQASLNKRLNWMIHGLYQALGYTNKTNIQRKIDVFKRQVYDYDENSSIYNFLETLLHKDDPLKLVEKVFYVSLVLVDQHKALPKPLTNEIQEELETIILPALRHHGIPHAFALPVVDDWLSLATTREMGNPPYRRRLKNLAALLSPRGKAFRFALYGQHLRRDFTMEVDRSDLVGLKALFPGVTKHLNQLFSVSKPDEAEQKEIDRYSIALTNGLNFPPPSDAPGKSYESYLRLLSEEKKIIEKAKKRASNKRLAPFLSLTSPDWEDSQMFILEVIEWNREHPDKPISVWQVLTGDPAADEFVAELSQRSEARTKKDNKKHIQALKTAYESLKSAAEKKINVGDISSLFDLPRGAVNMTFPLPNGKKIGRQKRLGLGENLIAVSLVLEKRKDAVIYFRFASTKTNGVSGEIELYWDESGGRLFTHKASQIEKLKMAYYRINRGEQSINIGSIGELVNSYAQLKRVFPLPNGTRLGTSLSFGLVTDPNAVSLELIKREDKIYFIFNYEKESKKGTTELLWDIDKEIFITSKSAHVQKIKDAYEVLGKSKPGYSVIIGDISDLVFLSSGMLGPSFPLPAGVKVEKAHYVGLGENLRAVNLKLSKSENGNIYFVFSFIKNNGVKGSAQVFWDEGGYEFKSRLSIKIDEVKKAYTKLQTIPRVTIGNVNELVDLSQGRLIKGFPLPDGKIADRFAIGAGTSLSSVSLTLMRENTEIGFVFDYVKESGAHGSTEWWWDNVSQEFIKRGGITRVSSLKSTIPGVQEILDYIKALREGSDLTQVTQRLKPFEMKTGVKGHIHFGRIAGRDAVIGRRSLSKGDLVKITPILIDERDPSKGAHLIIESNGKIWRYAFKKAPNYFAQAATQEKLERAQSLKSLLSTIYRKKNDFEETVDITDLFSRRALRQGLIPEDFPLPGGRVWGPDNREIQAGKNLGRVEAIIKKSQGKLSIDFIGYRRSEIRSGAVAWFPEKQGKQLIKQYAEALLADKNLNQVIESLNGKKFKIKVPPSGVVMFPPTFSGAHAAIQSLPPKTEIEVEVHLDRNGNIYLQIKIPDSKDRYFEFVKGKRYLHARPIPGMKEIADYARSLLRMEDLNKAAKLLEGLSFKVEVHEGGRITFPNIAKFSPQITNIPPQSEVAISAIVIRNAYGNVQDAYLKINIPNEKPRIFRFKKAVNYIEASLLPGQQEFLEYLQAFVHGKDPQELKQLSERLQKFVIKATKSGKISLGSVEGKNARITNLPPDKEITVRPLIEAEGGGQSQLVYLELQIPSEPNRYFKLKKEPYYLEARYPIGQQELVTYVEAFVEGKDYLTLEQAANHLRDFVMRVGESGTISLGTVKGNQMQILYLPAGQEIRFIPMIERNDKGLFKEVYYEVRIPNQEVRYYTFKKEGRWLKSRLAPGLEEILNYIRALVVGEDETILNEMISQLRTFKMKVPSGRHIQIGTFQNVDIRITNLPVGEEVTIAPLVESRTEGAPKEAHLEIRIPGKSSRYYGFKSEPPYLYRQRNSEELQKVREKERLRGGIIDKINLFYEQSDDFEKTIDITPVLSNSELKRGLIPADFPLPGGGVWGQDNREIQAGKNLGRVEVILKKEQGKLSIDFIGYRRSEMRDVFLSAEPVTPIVAERVAGILKSDWQNSRPMDAIVGSIRRSTFRYFREAKTQLAARLLTSGQGNLTALGVVKTFEAYGLPIGSTDAQTVTAILSSAHTPLYSEAKLREAKEVLDAIAHQKIVIEYRISETSFGGENKARILEELLQTAQNFVAVSPRSEVRFVVQSRTNETDLRRMIGRLNHISTKGVSIMNASRVHLWMAPASPDMILTMEPLRVLKQSNASSVFDLKYLANGNPADSVTPAQFLLGAVAALLKDKIVEGIVRRENHILQFQDENAAAGFNLFIQVLALQAQAQIRTVIAA